MKTSTVMLIVIGTLLVASLILVALIATLGHPVSSTF